MPPSRPAADGGAPPELIEEGMFRAARFGVDASLPDHDGHLRPVAELLDDALQIATRHAAELAARPNWRNCRGCWSAAGAPGASGGCMSWRVWTHWCGTSPR